MKNEIGNPQETGKIFRDTSRPKIELGFRELNPRTSQKNLKLFTERNYIIDLVKLTQIWIVITLFLIHFKINCNKWFRKKNF